ncbi:MAG: DUF3078 domain-containing protein [Weeksellaceae bacterium]
MRKICLILSILGFVHLNAQTVDADGNLHTDSEKKLAAKSANGRLQGWYKSGKNNLQFNQAAFSNWIAGGVNSYALTGNLDYEFNWTKNRHIWDNRFILAYGVLKNEGEDYRKSNDVIDFTTSYGYEFSPNFYFAAAANLKTQFSTGYDYNVQDEVTGAYQKISNIMAPGYLTFGLGVDYKPSPDLQVSFHPITSRFTFVMDEALQYAGNFGLKEDGDSFVYGLGAYIGARYKFKIMDNVTFDNQIGIFSDYLKDPLNMDIAYMGLLDFKINSFLSAQASINLFYDEDQITRIQLKETFGIGLSYNFNNTETLKSRPENYPTIEELQKSLDKAQENVDKANKALEDARNKLEGAQ